MEGAKRLAAKSEACSRVPATQPKAAGRATSDVHQAFCAALSTLPYPTSRWPSAGEGRIYTAWQELLETPVVYASNQVRRLEHLVQVNVYSEQPLTAKELEKVRHALQSHGIRVSLGPELYDHELKRHHRPLTCRWQEPAFGGAVEVKSHNRKPPKRRATRATRESEG